MKTEFTGYWTFFCRPTKWAIDRLLETNPERDHYMIAGWQADHIGPGQLGVIRVGVDRRNSAQLAGRPRLESGVYALVEVEGTPVLTPKDDTGVWLEPEPVTGSRLSVPIRIVANLLAEPVLLSTLAADGGSWDRFLMGGFQAAAMPLGRATFDRIVALAGRSDETFDTVRRGSTDTLAAIAELERRYRNASPVVREAVSRRIERGAVAQRVKRLAGYRCMVCEALGRPALGFRKPSGEPYVEAHHVVPVARLALGSLGVANIMTVCANHHRELHFGDVEQLEVLPGGWRFRIGRDAVEVPRLTSRSDDLSGPSDGAPPQD